MSRVRIEVPMNEEYRVTKDENNETKVTKANKEETTLIDHFSNTFPRSIQTLIGKISCVENGLLYLFSDNMKISDVRKPYREIKKSMNKIMKRTHHVEHFNILELLITADSILSSKNLVANILSYEDFKDFENVDLLSVRRVKSGIVDAIEPFHNRKSYTKSLKKVIWEIKNAFSDLEEAAIESGAMEEGDHISPDSIRDFSKDDYKIFKNSVKEVLVEIIIERIGEDTNIMSGVTGAAELKAKDLATVWLR